MKKVILLLLVVFINVGEAKVWRVDNNATNKPDFTNLQLAHEGASAGDTLCIAGHGSSYGGLTISKQIVVIGTGYFQDQNLNNGVNPFEAQIYQIVFNPGAENSVIISCSVTQIVIYCNNIILKRNRIIGERYDMFQRGGAIIGGMLCSGIIVQQCFISCPGDDYAIQLTGDNFVISNNIVEGSLSIVSSGSIKNNVVIRGMNISGMLCENNIGGIGGSGNIVRNNVELSDMNTLFMLTGNEDAKYILKEGSPAKGAGVNGVDCGIFGGDEPYILSGIPPIPTIYEAIVPSTVTTKDGLPVKIKAKANN